MRIGFIGAGNMATALAGAIAAREGDIHFIVRDVSSDQIARFSAGLSSVRAADDNPTVAAQADVTFLAVKPQVMSSVLAELTASDGLFVSIAAGVTIATLEHAMPNARVVRVMPNTPCLVGEMAAGYALGAKVTKADRDLVNRLLSSAGVALELPEELLDAVTGLSGSGPAFVARLIEAFTRAGVAEGLPENVAYQLTLATFSGTARLLQEKELSPDQLVTLVSSPGGTTVAGRGVLEHSDLSGIVRQTIHAAANRSRELGGWGHSKIS